jgi:hypothetical protein
MLLAQIARQLPHDAALSNRMAIYPLPGTWCPLPQKPANSAEWTFINFALFMRQNKFRWQLKSWTRISISSEQ